MIIDCHVNIWESKDATNEYNKQFSRIKPGNYSPPTPNIETIFLISKPEFSFISSSLVKQIAHMGGNISKFVSPGIEESIKEKI